MIRPLFLLVMFFGVVFLGGCNSRQTAVLSVGASGSFNEHIGAITYIDDSGQQITTPTILLPWYKTVNYRPGQKLSVSVRGVFPRRNYYAQIELGHNADDSKIVASKRGPGGQEVTCTYPAE